MHPVLVQVQDFMMQNGQGWNRDVLALPGCAAELSSACSLVWWETCSDMPGTYLAALSCLCLKLTKCE